MPRISQAIEVGTGMHDLDWCSELVESRSGCYGHSRCIFTPLPLSCLTVSLPLFALLIISLPPPSTSLSPGFFVLLFDASSFSSNYLLLVPWSSVSIVYTGGRKEYEPISLLEIWPTPTIYFLRCLTGL
ncbi:hypothetical protein SCLCIDRAFT_838580 [Scleroderma citrinum Foug A]|uniref:Uncharacterized protein n=1 Tax=Scleroderma citrinum Foug A TaxID=1036808 RepID=A0A0C3E2C4_9AGAM|nr:hypothetical protein SCLCIDRAFT_838580 [Scleroderma citrinum Foug A]